MNDIYMAVFRLFWNRGLVPRVGCFGCPAVVESGAVQNQTAERAELDRRRSTIYCSHGPLYGWDGVSKTIGHFRP